MKPPSQPPPPRASGSTSSSTSAPPIVKPEPQPQRPTKPLSSIPQHLRLNAASTPNNKEKNPITNAPVALNSSTSNGQVSVKMETGLNTPVQTPANQGQNQRVPNQNHRPIRAPEELRPPPPQRQQQSRPNLPQHQPQPQRPAAQPGPSTSNLTSDPPKHVTFAQPEPQPAAPLPPSIQPTTSAIPSLNPESQEDDFFGFNSEDDAFYATVDLGEGGIGEDGEDGIGGYIDFDEGIGTGLSREESTESLGGHFSGGERAVQDEGGAGPQAQVSDETRFLEQQRQEQNRPSTSVGVIPPTRLGASNQQDPSRSTSTSRGERPPTSTPTMGGFRFPPGLNPQNLGLKSTSNRPQGQPSSSESSSGIGLKRSSDAMQAQPVSRRPMQGMGLSGQYSGWNPGQGQGRREPLGALEVGEGGDVKRMRR